MRYLLFFILTFVGLANATEVRYRDQEVHERILFGDGWRGAYVKSFVNTSWNRVRFEYCGVEDEHSGCKPLAVRDIGQEELPVFSADFLARLRAIRAAHLVRLERHLVVKYISGRRDLEALDRIIASLESEGLDKWILLRANEELAPRFFTGDLSDQVASALAETIKLPAPKSPPKRSPEPYPQVAEILR